MDRELDQDTRDHITDLTRSVDGVRGMQDLRTRSTGPSIHAELHLEMDGHLDLHESHRIADRVERVRQAQFAGAEVTIHQEPFGLDDDRLDDRVQSASDRE